LEKETSLKEPRKEDPVEIATPFEVHGTSFDTLRVEAALQRVATEVEEGTF